MGNARAIRLFANSWDLIDLRTLTKEPRQSLSRSLVTNLNGFSSPLEWAISRSLNGRFKWDMNCTLQVVGNLFK